MNGLKYLLDSCFVLRYFGQAEDSLEIIAQHNIQANECAYSVITQAEALGYPLNNTDEQNLRLILSDFTKLAITEEVIDKTISIRKQHKIKLPDCLILSTAKVYHLKLITFDEKLQRIDKLV